MNDGNRTTTHSPRDLTIDEAGGDPRTLTAMRALVSDRPCWDPDEGDDEVGILRADAERVIAALDGTSPSMFDDVGAFHEKFGFPVAGVDRGPTLMVPSDLVDRIAFIIEELSETIADHRAGNLVKVADGIADLVWVGLGTAHFLGLPFDAVWAAVRRANMAKVRDESNKFLVGKPPGWIPPERDIASALRSAVAESFARSTQNADAKSRADFEEAAAYGGGSHS